MVRANPKRRHPLYPEPGATVIDTYEGMPALDPPDPLPTSGKLAAYQIRDQYIAYEGLGFCIYSYIPTTMIADPRLAKLWSEAQQALWAVVEYLETVPAPRMDKRKILPHKKPWVAQGSAILIGDPQTKE